MAMPSKDPRSNDASERRHERDPLAEAASADLAEERPLTDEETEETTLEIPMERQLQASEADLVEQAQPAPLDEEDWR
ncbi:MAG: hypothetical protein M0004_17310 [Actinomycetota bacterium]|nr:hypothetical protein [Actinomycetota bacterium]